MWTWARCILVNKGVNNTRNRNRNRAEWYYYFMVNQPQLLGVFRQSSENIPRMYHMKVNSLAHDNNGSECHKLITLICALIFIILKIFLFYCEDNNAQWFHRKIHHTTYLQQCQKFTHLVNICKCVLGMFSEVCRKAPRSCDCMVNTSTSSMRLRGDLYK